RRSAQRCPVKKFTATRQGELGSLPARHTVHVAGVTTGGAGTAGAEGVVPAAPAAARLLGGFPFIPPYGICGVTLRPPAWASVAARSRATNLKLCGTV